MSDEGSPDIEQSPDSVQLVQPTVVRNREFINKLKKKTEKELDKRIRIIDQQIKRREKELENEGIDFRKTPGHGLENLFHNRKLTETAIDEKRDEKIK